MNNYSDKEKAESMFKVLPKSVQEMDNILLASIEGKENPVLVSYNKDSDEVAISVSSKTGFTNIGMSMKGAAGLVLCLKSLINKTIDIVDKEAGNEDFSEKFNDQCGEFEIEMISVKENGYIVEHEGESKTEAKDAVEDSNQPRVRPECICPDCEEERLKESSDEIISAIKSLGKSMEECIDEDSIDMAKKVIEEIEQTSIAAAMLVESGILDKKSMDEMREEYKETVMESIKKTEQILKAKPKKIETIIDFEKLRETFVKFGPQAAKETLMRIPADKRDQVTAELMSFLAKK